MDTCCQPNDLSSVPEIHCGRRGPVLPSCPLTTHPSPTTKMKYFCIGRHPVKAALPTNDVTVRQSSWRPESCGSRGATRTTKYVLDFLFLFETGSQVAQLHQTHCVAQAGLPSVRIASTFPHAQMTSAGSQL